MTNNAESTESAPTSNQRPRRGLLFWLAMALTPEATPFLVESSRGMQQRARLMREGLEPANEPEDSRRAA